jgi:hypothetical protein
MASQRPATEAEPPAGARVRYALEPNGIVIHVGHGRLGLWVIFGAIGLAVLCFAGGADLAHMTCKVLQRAWDGSYFYFLLPISVAPLVVASVMFGLPILLLHGLVVHPAWRRTRFTIHGETLEVTVSGRREMELSINRGELAGIRAVMQQGCFRRAEPDAVLSIDRTNDTPVRLLESHPPDELFWIARRLCRDLRLPVPERANPSDLPLVPPVPKTIRILAPTERGRRLGWYAFQSWILIVCGTLLAAVWSEWRRQGATSLTTGMAVFATVTILGIAVYGFRPVLSSWWRARHPAHA